MNKPKHQPAYIYNDGRSLRERGFRLETPPLHIVSFDPAGDGDDYGGMGLLAREEHQKGEPHDPDFAVEHMLRIKMALRMRQDMEFSEILAQMLRLHRYLNALRAQGLSYGHVFCIETNGVGYGYEKALRDKLPSTTPVIGYTTVGTTNDDTNVAKNLVMPRLAGLDNMRIQVETHHLKLEENMPGARELEGEFRAFVWRGPGRPEAMEGHNDDLVMSIAGGVWCATRLIPPALKAAQPKPGKAGSSRNQGSMVRRVH